MLAPFVSSLCRAFNSLWFAFGKVSGRFTDIFDGRCQLPEFFWRKTLNQKRDAIKHFRLDLNFFTVLKSFLNIYMIITSTFFSTSLQPASSSNIPKIFSTMLFFFQSSFEPHSSSLKSIKSFPWKTKAFLHGSFNLFQLFLFSASKASHQLQWSFALADYSISSKEHALPFKAFQSVTSSSLTCYLQDCPHAR